MVTRRLKTLAEAFGVESDLFEVASVITQRLENEPTAADLSSVASVVGILLSIDSRNIKRLRDAHRIPKAQRALMVKMVAGHNPDVDADDFVGRVLIVVGTALAALN